MVEMQRLLEGVRVKMGVTEGQSYESCTFKYTFYPKGNPPPANDVDGKGRVV
jgi:hypothetical protein